jgi:NAD(P)-dependent dehydrogenase (short-subunit alcohol dehydrogenase family)
MDSFSLHGKVALVTGGSRGLGRAIALGFARAGADVIVSSRNGPASDRVAREIAALGRRSLGVACDMGDPTEIDALVDRVFCHFDRCDVLVNNAGVTQSLLPLVETPDTLFDDIQAVNLRGPLHLSTRLAPRMASSGGGSILHILSTAAVQPVGCMGAYTASKAALRALTRVMAEEWAPLGVRVNAIAPGTFLTDMMDDLERKMPGFIERAAANSLMKRPGDPEEIVGPAIFLASEASSYVTGQTLAVCGGVL